MEARQARLKAEKKAKSEAKKKSKVALEESEPSSSTASAVSVSELTAPLIPQNGSSKLPTKSKLTPVAASSSKLLVGNTMKFNPGW